MLPDRVSNPGPLTYESGALPTALRGPARSGKIACIDERLKRMQRGLARISAPSFRRRGLISLDHRI